jgi:hypothetical protein
VTAHFLSALELHQLVDDVGRPVLTDDGRCQWCLDAPLQYVDGQGYAITVPAIDQGLTDAQVYAAWLKHQVMTTDLASDPPGSREILPPDGPWAKIAVIHDFLYKTKGTGLFLGKCWITKPGGYSRDQADQVLDEGMGILGVPEDKRVLIYEGVRVGGWTGWGS